MRRKVKQVEQHNHERWLVSYADFITLLFAFFVVMYSVSSVNEGKFRVLSESLIAAFRAPPTTLDPIQVGKLKRTSTQKSIEVIKKPAVIDLAGIPKPGSYKKKKEKTVPEPDQDMKDLFASLRAAMAALMEKGLVQMKGDENGIEVEISSKMLFESGSAKLTVPALPTLQKIAEILQPYPNSVSVQGHTDNRAINSNIYPTNWELSAARAASVVHLFTRNGVDPRRLTATGYGEFRPVTTNETPEGRVRNRRVVLFIPVSRDKDKVMKAISRIGDKVYKGISITDPKGVEPAEGIRNRLKPKKDEVTKITSPTGERRIITPAEKRAAQAGKSTQPRVRSFDELTRPFQLPLPVGTPATRGGGAAETGPHISRQPIKATPDANKPAN